MANKLFWELRFHIEPWVAKFARDYYTNNLKLSYKNEIGLLALGVIKLNRYYTQEQMAGFVKKKTERFGIQVRDSYHRRIKIKRYDQCPSYSMSFNNALKQIFQREYIKYMEISEEQLRDVNADVNYTELTRRFLIKYEVAESDVNMRSLRQVFDRKKQAKKIHC